MVTMENHAPEVIEEFANAMQRAKVRMGQQAEGYAKENLTTLNAVDTGTLRTSIGFEVDGEDVIIGTDINYAIYVEMGTGKYYPGGRQEPWVYKDGKGQWHRTSGVPARPYLKPAVANHPKTYLNIIKDELQGG